MRGEKEWIVADGRRRILDGPRYQWMGHELRHRMKRRCARLLAEASLAGKLIIHFRIRKAVQRRLDKIAPPQAFYYQSRQRVIALPI